METFSGSVLHSAQYKQKELFAGKRVLVLGCGETGMDIAYRSVQTAAETGISIRHGFLSVTGSD
jgi:cation diffusion facilitator CzcD-associated flavoprotein CzcO